jgi:hypothetical protein
MKKIMLLYVVFICLGVDGSAPLPASNSSPAAINSIKDDSTLFNDDVSEVDIWQDEETAGTLPTDDLEQAKLDAIQAKKDADALKGETEQAQADAQAAQAQLAASQAKAQADAAQAQAQINALQAQIKQAQVNAAQAAAQAKAQADIAQAKLQAQIKQAQADAKTQAQAAAAQAKLQAAADAAQAQANELEEQAQAQADAAQAKLQTAAAQAKAQLDAKLQAATAGAQEKLDTAQATLDELQTKLEAKQKQLEDDVNRVINRAKESVTVNVTVEGGGDGLKEKLEEGLLPLSPVALFVLARLALPRIMTFYHYLNGNITGEEASKILAAKGKNGIANALAQKLDEKGLTADADAVRGAQKIMDSAGSVLERIQKIRENGFDITSKDLQNVADFIQTAQVDPAKAAEKFGKPVEEVKALRDSIVEALGELGEIAPVNLSAEQQVSYRRLQELIGIGDEQNQEEYQEPLGQPDGQDEQPVADDGDGDGSGDIEGDGGFDVGGQSASELAGSLV